MIKLMFRIRIGEEDFDRNLNLEEAPNEEEREKRIRDLFRDAADHAVRCINEKAPIATTQETPAP